MSMQQMWDMLLYPYVAPVASLSGGTTIEYGGSPIIQLIWSATKGTKPITTITVNGVSKIVTGNNQSGTQTDSSVQNTQTTLSMVVQDVPGGPSTVSSSTTVYWSNKRYWGTLPSGHALTSISSSTFAHTDITSLSNELNPNYVMTKTITTNFDYVVFIWPHNSVDLSTNPPHVSIGGFGNNNWIKTRNNVQYTNQFGYTTYYDVWVFGNTQAPNTFTYVIT